MVLRSILFNLLFYANLILWMVVFLPFIFLPRSALRGLMMSWARSSVWLLRVIAGVRLDVRGPDGRLSGPLLIAAKHQSLFETFALLPLFTDPVFVLKHELTLIPVFGWWIRKMGMISIRRDKGAKALKEMARAARAAAQSGRQVLIFPEGTRRPPGAAPDYKAGVALLYQDIKVPCVPVALNSGLYWPRRKWQRYPGTILVALLDEIPAGLPRQEFMTRLECEIETASGRLLAEAAASKNPPPLPESARTQLRAAAESA